MSLTVRSLAGPKFLAAFGLAMLLSSCASKFEGTYSDPAQEEIVDDKWNETDAKKTANSMISQMLNKSWLGEYTTRKKTKPVVVVGEVENRSDEHIDTVALTESIQDELINSGKVRFVEGAKRQKILDEVKYQNSGVTSGATKKVLGKQIGADYILTGELSSSVHTQSGLKTVTYQVILKLLNVETSEIEWSSKELIKKRMKRSGAGW